MGNSLALALVGSVTSLLVAVIGFFAAVRAASVFAFVQLCRNVDLAMRQRIATDPTPPELAALKEGLKAIRGPIARFCAEAKHSEG